MTTISAGLKANNWVGELLEARSRKARMRRGVGLGILILGLMLAVPTLAIYLPRADSENWAGSLMMICLTAMTIGLGVSIRRHATPFRPRLDIAHSVGLLIIACPFLYAALANLGMAWDMVRIQAPEHPGYFLVPALMCGLVGLSIVACAGYLFFNRKYFTRNLSMRDLYGS